MSTIPPNETTTRDITFEIGDFANSPEVSAIREQKPQIFEQIQDYYDATVEPANPGNISLVERVLIAQRTAAGIPSPVLATWYQTRLDALHGEIDESAPRIKAILGRISLVNTDPDRTTSEDVQALQKAGLDETAIIAVSQLIAFIHYQARLLSGLNALGARS